MFNFFNPPAPKPRLSQDKIPAKYAQMRLRVFWVRFWDTQPTIWCARIFRSQRQA